MAAIVVDEKRRRELSAAVAWCKADARGEALPLPDALEDRQLIAEVLAMFEALGPRDDVA